MIKHFIYGIITPAVFFISCQNKVKNLLVKKWDCVKVENLAPVNKTFLSHEDSLVTSQLETALQNLSWQFNSDNTYMCSTAGIVTTQGSYLISDDAVTLTCTTKNNTNYYIITTLSAQELVLKSQGISIPVIMYFKPH